MVHNLLLLLFSVHVLAVDDLVQAMFPLHCCCFLCVCVFLIWRLCCYAINAFRVLEQCSFIASSYPHSSLWATAVNLFSGWLGEDRWWWHDDGGAVILTFFPHLIFWSMSSIWLRVVQSWNSNDKGVFQSILKRAINTKLYVITNAFY